VELLEERYPEFPGLNLSWEVREAFVQHSRCRDLPECREYLTAGGPLLEAQLVDACDSLAYGTHDTDDALGIGLVTLAELEDVDLWARAARTVRRQYTAVSADAFRTAVIRELIAWQVGDLIGETERRLAAHPVRSVADVRAAAEPLAGFGPELVDLKAGLGKFLYERVYRHHRVVRMAAQGQRILRRLYAEFTARPELLPERFQARWAGAPAAVRQSAGTSVLPPEPSVERVVADYLAGMTDRFARQEYVRLFQPDGDQ
jgi:dGTPase